jgi:transposase
MRKAQPSARRNRKPGQPFIYDLSLLLNPFHGLLGLSFPGAVQPIEVVALDLALTLHQILFERQSRGAYRPVLSRLSGPRRWTRLLRRSKGGSCQIVRGTRPVLRAFKCGFLYAAAMTGRPKANLEFTEMQRKELEGMVRAGTGEKRMVFRARLILECATGVDNVQVAKRLGTTEQTVTLWRRRFLHGVEPWGRWTDGKKARIEARLHEVPRADVDLILYFHAFVRKSMTQHVTLQVNGVSYGTRSFAEGNETEWTVRIACSRLADKKLDIDLDLPDAMAPASVSSSTDTRLLGIGLTKMLLNSGSKDL